MSSDLFCSMSLSFFETSIKMLLLLLLFNYSVSSFYFVKMYKKNKEKEWRMFYFPNILAIFTVAISVVGFILKKTC